MKAPETPGPAPGAALPEHGFEMEAEAAEAAVPRDSPAESVDGRDDDGRQPGGDHDQAREIEHLLDQLDHARAGMADAVARANELSAENVRLRAALAAREVPASTLAGDALSEERTAHAIHADRDPGGPEGAPLRTIADLQAVVPELDRTEAWIAEPRQIANDRLRALDDLSSDLSRGRSVVATAVAGVGLEAAAADRPQVQAAEGLDEAPDTPYSSDCEEQSTPSFSSVSLSRYGLRERVSPGEDRAYEPHADDRSLAEANADLLRENTALRRQVSSHLQLIAELGERMPRDEWDAYTAQVRGEIRNARAVAPEREVQGSAPTSRGSSPDRASSGGRASESYSGDGLDR